MQFGGSMVLRYFLLKEGLRGEELATERADSNPMNSLHGESHHMHFAYNTTPSKEKKKKTTNSL